MKKRLLLTILSTVLILLVVSLGYATWSIIRSTSDQEEGNFTAYATTDTGEITVSIDTNDDQIIFGKKAFPAQNAPTNYDWLRVADVADEKLTVTVHVNFSKFDGFGAEGVKFNVSLSMGIITDGAISSAYSVPSRPLFNYTISARPTEANIYAASNASYENSIEDNIDGVITFSGADKVQGSIDLIVAFSWNLPAGFDSNRANSLSAVIPVTENPFVAYNSLEKTNDLALEAFNYLNAINDAVSAENFGYILTVEIQSN